MNIIKQHVNGLARRRFRAKLQSEVNRAVIRRSPGCAHCSGYGFDMVFPDRLVWAYQILQLFKEDCYGVHKLPATCTVVDAGANIGSFSLFVKWMKPNANVIAIEPSPENLGFLRKNLGHLLNNSVEIIPVALGSKNGAVRLSGTVTDSFRTGDVGDVEVEARTLSKIIAGRTVDLLKMDIEGAELEVLNSSVAELKQVKRVVIEYHRYRNRYDRISEIIAALERAGFDRFSIGSESRYDWKDETLPVYCCHVEASRL